MDDYIVSIMQYALYVFHSELQVKIFKSMLHVLRAL